MKTLLKRRIAAIFVAGILLFSNYGILAFADEVDQENQNPTEQVSEDINEEPEQDLNNEEDLNEEPEQDLNNEEDLNEEQKQEEQQEEEQEEEQQQDQQEQDLNSEEKLNEEQEFQTFDLDFETLDADEEAPAEPFEGEVTTEETAPTQLPIVVVYDPTKNISSGIGVGGFIPTIFQFEYTDTDNVVKLIEAYCNQYEIFIQNGAQYQVEPVYESNDPKVNKLRGILLNGYPTKTLDELRIISGLADLTKEEAIAGTQMAIWNLERAEDKKFNTDNPKAKALYELLMEKEQASDGNPSLAIQVGAPEVELVENVVKVKYSYKISNASQIRNSQIIEELDLEGFEVVSRIVGEDGMTTVILSKTIEDMEQEFSFAGNIKIDGSVGFYDIYNLRHTPTPGKETSQGLISLPFIKNYNLPGFSHLINFKYTPPVKPPVEEPPVEEPPVDEPPIDTPPTEEPPVEEPPVVIPPIEQPPVNPPTPDDEDDDEDDEDEVVVVEEETPLGLPVEPVIVVAQVTPIDDAQEEIVEDIVPLAVPQISVPEEIVEEDLPLGAPVLPKTGGFAPEILYAIGLGLIGLGYKSKK